MDDLIQLIQKTYGIAGLILLSPFVGLYFVYRDNRSLRVENAELHKSHAASLQGNAKDALDRVSQVHDKVTAAQVQRVQDAQGITTMLITIVSEQSGLNKETNIILERISDYLPKRVQSLDPHRGPFRTGG